MSSSGEFPFPGFDGWVRGQLRKHGWGTEEIAEVIRVMENYMAVLTEHDPDEVGAEAFDAVLDAIEEGDLEKLREAGRVLSVDARRRGGTREPEETL